MDQGQGPGSASKDLGIQNLEKIIQFYQKSQLTRFVILGGEPTLHPCFDQMLTRVLAEPEFKSVMIFSNGLMPEKVLEYLSMNPDPRIQIAMNLNAPEYHTDSQWFQALHTMKTLGKRIGLGINVYESGQKYDYLLDAIQEFGLSAHIRVGLTQPIVASKNLYAREEAFPAIAEDLLAFAERAYKRGVGFSFDCGFRFCMFTLEQHKELLRFGIKFKAVCSPIIDIAPDLSVWRCFPLINQAGVSLNDFSTKNQLIHYYNEIFKAFIPMGNKPECPQCLYRVNNLCNGGCLARTLSSFHR
jgi:radical SAM protein with 4Fe4S-binding SPASM domain